MTARPPSNEPVAKAKALITALLLAAATVQADSGYYESEPNDTPAEANPVSGELTIFGTMVGTDQDGFLWTVTDDDARKRWTLELRGIPGALTIAEVVRVHYADDNGDVASTDRLLKIATRDGLTPAVAAELLFEPGEYLIGITHSGGGTGAYRFSIREGSRLAVSENPGARASRATAQSLRAGREFATFETRSTTWYSFAFTQEDATRRWDIPVQAPVGRVIEATLYDDAGAVLAKARSGDHGRLAFPDLSPRAKTYFLELAAGEPGFVHAVRSEVVGQRVAGEEAEPNGKWELANRVDLAQPLTGRVGEDNEWDYFLFELDESAADQQLALRIDATEAGQAMEFCLLTGSREAAKCVRDKTPIELGGLVLRPGTWGVSVGRAKQGAEYRLSLAGQGPIEPGMEAEPNDAIGFANGAPANNRIKGRLDGDDHDYYRFTIAEEPQLWRFQVIGEGLAEIAYHDGAGKQVARVRPDKGQGRARFENLFLLPGTHFIRVSGKGGADYTLLARPLGPPDPNGEREPNDDASLMQRLAIGQTRTGLLADLDDKDYYRFFLANWDHVRLTLQPPADAIVDPYLYWYGSPFADGKPREKGKPITLQGLLPPGDYHLSLSSRTPSDGEYRLSLERLPRFGCPADCEPSGFGDFYRAWPVPRDGVLQGATGEWRDVDLYQLPAGETPYELVIRTETPPRHLAVGPHRLAGEALRYDVEAGRYQATVPAGGPYQLIVDSSGEPYRLALEYGNGAPALPGDGALPVTLELSVEADTVSAYRTLGQRVAGAMELTNSGSAPLELTLEAATSDYRWSLDLEHDRLTLDAGGSASVPFHVRVPADAWAERPVRLSVAVRDAAGAQVEGWREITVRREVAPVDPDMGWSVPDALLGGLNAAWSPLGAEWAEQPDDGIRRPEFLRDGLVFEGSRIECCSTPYGWEGERPSMTLELPGEREQPVAGIALNHFGSSSPFHNVRLATLSLSRDGQSYEDVLRIGTLPVETEQFFALPEPMPARFVRLRVDETFHFRSGAGGVKLGEWKVVLQPGHDLSGGAGFNLADPGLGGHVVWDTPPQPYLPRAILSAEKESARVRLKDGVELEYAIGFHQNRAAQIQRVEWVSPADIEANMQLDKVVVSVSIDSPVGPWRVIGELDTGAAAPTAALELEQPVWARFVRFSGVRREGSGIVASPSVIRIWERPTGPEYRSVLGEWGYGDYRGPFEFEQGLPPDPELRVVNNVSRDRAAPLVTGQTAEGEVALARVEHWYRLSTPPGENVLRIELTGQPTVRAALEAQDAGGNPVAARRLPRESTPGRHAYEVLVEPGAELWLRVFEPPRNVVFSWDTSASTNAYLPTIYNALAAFAGQVVPGQEAVNLAPFGRSLLLRDWFGEPYVLQTILNDYPRTESSSSAEETLKNAAKSMANLPGTKAIVAITDGITVHDGYLWEQMKAVQPRVFGVHVGGDEDWNIDVFEDWARVNGGDYRQLIYDGEMEVAFDRAATLMRWPTAYRLRVDSEFREAPGPGRLSVAAAAATAMGGAAVELILDASGSMLQRMEGKRRIVVAKEVLSEAVREHIPAGTPLALRVFGHREADACRTDLEIPLAPLDPAAAAAKIAGIQAMNLARTPIADSLAAIEGDLKGAGGRAAIVLVTDGEETCEGDPAAVIEALQKKGFDVSLNIVGFAIGDPELEAQFESWANLGGGRYFSAQNQQGLSEALREALRIPFTVYDAGGNEVARGVVGGEPVEIGQGIYRVEVASTPPRSFEAVDVPGEKSVTLQLE